LAGDVTNWPKAIGETGIDQLPGAAPIIQELKTKTGKADVESFMKAYTSQPNLTPQEVAKRMDDVRNLYRTTLTRVQRNSIFGSGLDVAGMVRAAEAAAVRAKIKSDSFNSRPMGDVEAPAIPSLKDLFTVRVGG
jgi:hypothetical protein